MQVEISKKIFLKSNLTRYFFLHRHIKFSLTQKNYLCINTPLFGENNLFYILCSKLSFYFFQRFQI